MVYGLLARNETCAVLKKFLLIACRLALMLKLAMLFVFHITTVHGISVGLYPTAFGSHLRWCLVS
jgi:hypothetical protein